MMIVKVSKTKLAELEITKLRICSQITICEDRNGDDEDRNGLYDKDKIICIFIYVNIYHICIRIHMYKYELALAWHSRLARWTASTAGEDKYCDDRVQSCPNIFSIFKYCPNNILFYG